MKTLHELVADKLGRANPASRETLLCVALDNINRWLANGHSAPHRLEEWRQILLRARRSTEGLQELLQLLRAEDGNSQRLKDFAPFAGVLTQEERRQAAPECVYNF